MKLEIKRNDLKRSLPQAAVSIVLAVIICVINLKIVSSCFHPFVFADEAGYWTNAATFAGYDWSGVSTGLSWYSYGYSLLLSVLMRIFHDAAVLYKAALVMNTVMLAAVYFIYIRIIKELFSEISPYAVYFAAFAATMYTPYQVQTGIAWSETLVLLVTVLITYTIMRIIKKPSYLNCAALGLLCAYLYTIHNRCLGVIASAFLTILLAVFLKRVRLRHAAAFSGLLLSGFAVHSLIKGFLEGRIWINGIPVGNDMGSTLGKLKSAFSSVADLKKFISLLMSQSFASFVTTMCISVAAIWFIAKILGINAVKIAKAIKNKKDLSAAADKDVFVYFFVVCSFFSSLFITSVFMFSFTRADHIVYTRYFDMTTGILIAIGICSLVSVLSDGKYGVLLSAFIPLLMFAGANRAGSLWGIVPNRVFNRAASPAIAYMFKEYDANFSHYAVLASALFGTAAIVALILKKRGNIFICLFSGIFAALSVNGAAIGRENITFSQEAYAEDFELMERLDSSAAESGGDIYILRSCGTFKWFCQYALLDTLITTVEDIGGVPENSYVIADVADMIMYSDHKILDRSDKHLVFSSEKDQTGADADGFYRLPLSFMKTTDKALYDSDMDSISSSDTNNYVCYGPYFRLNAGEYTFRLNVSGKTEADDSEDVGYAEVISTITGDTYSKTEITADMFDEASVNIELPSDIDADIEDMEIRIFIYDPACTAMTVNYAEYRKGS